MFFHLSNKYTATSTSTYWTASEEMQFGMRKAHQYLGTKLQTIHREKINRSRKREQTDQINPNLEGNKSKPRMGK
jgi:hypothetical protein